MDSREEMLARCQRERTRWLAEPRTDAETRAALRAQSREETLDSFYQRLAFGTGGLRGLLGPGTNRMNLYTVRWATQALAAYLLDTALPRRVAIAHDSRTGGEAFAKAAAETLAANGIQAWLYPRLQPTPALSFAVRALGCGVGICITASHNPAQYNGYKVYGPDGCQITPEAARAIEARMRGLDILSGARAADFASALAAGDIRWIPEEVLDRYLEAVRELAPASGASDLRVVYTPLNGAGLECVTRALAGRAKVRLVEAQAMPDGSFPTCPYPNPEIPEALALGLAECRRWKPDLLLATDPDCDRVGVAAPIANGDYALLTGNEIGLLLLDDVCARRKAAGTLPKAPVAITTIVSSAIADKVAGVYGVELRRVLTGFKFIGEQIGLLERAGQAERFVFGFEESNGYLSGTHVRDKDGVNAALLVCEMARRHKEKEHTLHQALEALCQTCGYEHTSLHSFTFPGAEGMNKMGALMDSLRAHPPKAVGALAVSGVTDYAEGETGLPKADVLAFALEGEGKLMIRPSGTEPKIKAYVFAVGKSRESAAGLAEEIRRGLAALMAQGTRRGKP